MAIPFFLRVECFLFFGEGPRFGRNEMGDNAPVMEQLNCLSGSQPCLQLVEAFGDSELAEGDGVHWAIIGSN